MPSSFVRAAPVAGGVPSDYLLTDGVFVAMDGNCWIDLRCSVTAVVSPGSAVEAVDGAGAQPPELSFWF